MPTKRLHRCNLFFEAADGWKTVRGSQSMARKIGLKILARVLSISDPVRLLGWGSRDRPYPTEWVEVLRLNPPVTGVFALKTFLLR